MSEVNNIIDVIALYIVDHVRTKDQSFNVQHNWKDHYIRIGTSLDNELVCYIDLDSEYALLRSVTTKGILSLVFSNHYYYYDPDFLDNLINDLHSILR